MKRLLISFLALAICGCTSVEFVRKDISPTKQGILRHSPPSNEAKAAEYKVLVEEKAREYCGGNFKITKEYEALGESRTTAGVGTGFGVGRRSSILIGGSGPSERMYHFVEFACQ